MIRLGGLAFGVPPQCSADVIPWVGVASSCGRCFMGNSVWAGSFCNISLKEIPDEVRLDHFRRGHVPILGVNLAFPVIQAGRGHVYHSVEEIPDVSNAV